MRKAKFISKFADELMQRGDKMVFGFGEGKIEIFLEKVNFSLGDTIKGTVSLKMNKPKKAKQLRLVFAGERIITQRSVNARGRHSTNTKREFVHRFEMSLDREKEYFEGEYPFEIKIPENLLQKQQIPEIGGAAGAILQTMSLLASPARVEWYVEASLDMPMSVDIKKRVQINVA